MNEKNNLFPPNLLYMFKKQKYIMKLNTKNDYTHNFDFLLSKNEQISNKSSFYIRYCLDNLEIQIIMPKLINSEFTSSGLTIDYDNRLFPDFVINENIHSNFLSENFQDIVNLWKYNNSQSLVAIIEQIKSNFSNYNLTKLENGISDKKSNIILLRKYEYIRNLVLFIRSKQEYYVNKKKFYFHFNKKSSFNPNLIETIISYNLDIPEISEINDENILINVVINMDLNDSNIKISTESPEYMNSALNINKNETFSSNFEQNIEKYEQRIYSFTQNMNQRKLVYNWICNMSKELLHNFINTI